MGKKNEDQKNYKQAIKYYLMGIAKNPDHKQALLSAQLGSKIAQYEIMDFYSAVKFNKFIILKSKNIEERINANKNIISIYFDLIQDYEKVIPEIETLLLQKLPVKENVEYRLKLARANTYIGNFTQAKIELNEIIKLNIDEDFIFQALLYIANINLNEKKFSNAILVFKDLEQKFPNRFKQENIFISMALCYEEDQEYSKAIELLEKYNDNDKNKDFITLRIRRVKERIKNKPGSIGLGKK